jgi:nitric oxide reductase activation protein
VAVNRGNVFHYPEWDSERGSYRPGWCRVVEEPLESAGFTPYGRGVLDAHRATVTKLLREWGRLPREGMTLARSLPDGDQIDIDAAIGARIELRAGGGSDANVYTRKVPVGRDVVCAILVDVSMSTADHIEPDPDKPFTVDETAMRLYGRPYRTVLDHERETAFLLAEIMERVSDLSIVYSFSSTGRNNVRLQRVKGVRERSRIATASRLQNLRPLDATRMGAAVRHASAQLARTDARSKLLVVISDGLPYDEDYGDEYGPRKDAYAVNDTVRAFDEAETAGVRSVLFLTGDQDLGRLADLGHRAVHVPHPDGLAEAVVSRYLRAREVAQHAVRP